MNYLIHEIIPYKTTHQPRRLLPGFSTIELIIVLTIISLLASMATGAYQTYLYETEMAQIVNAMSAFKAYFEEDYFTHDTSTQFRVPNFGLTGSTNYSFTTANGGTQNSLNITFKSPGINANTAHILVQVNSTLDSGQIMLLMSQNQGNIQWYCGFYGPGAAQVGTSGKTRLYAPKVCQDTNLSTY